MLHCLCFIVKMKILLAFAFFFAVASAAPRGSDLENAVNATIQQLKIFLPDPLDIPLYATKIPDNALVEGSVQISELSLEGLREFNVAQLHINEETDDVQLTVTWPKISFKTKHWADFLVLHFIPLNDDGIVDFTITDLSLKMNGVNELGDGTIFVRNVTAAIGIGSNTCTITGLLGDEELSKQLTDFLTNESANWINNNTVQVTEAISPVVELLLNLIMDLLVNGIPW